MSRHLLRSLVRKTDGKVIKAIGTSKQVNLEPYDRIILVYHWPLPPIRAEFMDFCKRHKGKLRNITLILDIPDAQPYEKVDYGLSKIKDMVETLKTECDIHLDNGIAIIESDSVDERTLMKYSTASGFRYIESFSGRDLYVHSMLISFFLPSEVQMEMSRWKSRFYLTVGLLMIPLGVAILIIGALVIDYPNRIGSLSFFMIISGIMTMYVGIKNRKFAH